MTAPTNTKAEKYVDLKNQRDINNEKIITWINNSADQTIGGHLAKFTTAKEIWDYLATFFI